MLKQKTVLVLGAGASMDYGMPSGAQLLTTIKKECHKIERGDYTKIEGSGFSTKPFVDLKHALMDTDFRSIDAFLSEYKEHNDAGKFMIAACLLPCENPNNFRNFGDQLNDPRENWMLYLFERMEGENLQQFSLNEITFITFNYDRCLDCYLRGYIRGRYRAKEDEIEATMQHLPIYHVHGQLGTLAQMPFGELAKSYRAGPVSHAAKSIQIIHEAEENPQFKKASLALRDADRIGILGFGFHPTNINRLSMKEYLKGRMVFATSMNMSDPEVTEARIRMNVAGPSKFHPANCHYLCKHSELLF